jgi:hypothetical protein
VDEDLLKSVLTELRRENVDFLSKKRKDMNEKQDAKFRERSGQFVVLMDEPADVKSGIRRWIELWDSVDALLPKLISIAKIPSTEYRNFCLAMHERLLSFIHPDLSTDRDEKMLEVERRLRAAQDAINALSNGQRISITIATLGSIPFDGDYWFDQMLDRLVGIAKITGSGPYRPADPSKRGPRATLRINPVLGQFIRDLWRIARLHGGDFTVSHDPDNDRARGTIVKALDLLRPVLPPGIVPEVLSHTTLKRLRADRES